MTSSLNDVPRTACNNDSNNFKHLLGRNKHKILLFQLSQQQQKQRKKKEFDTFSQKNISQIVSQFFSQIACQYNLTELTVIQKKKLT